MWFESMLVFSLILHGQNLVQGPQRRNHVNSTSTWNYWFANSACGSCKSCLPTKLSHISLEYSRGASRVYDLIIFSTVTFARLRAHAVIAKNVWISQFSWVPWSGRCGIADAKKEATAICRWGSRIWEHAAYWSSWDLIMPPPSLDINYQITKDLDFRKTLVKLPLVIVEGSGYPDASTRTCSRNFQVGFS